jgi:enterochelin esterase-like enzyme
MRGRFDEVVFESHVLRNNPLRDPARRPLWVYLPPGFDDEPRRRYPAIYQIQGLTGQLDMWRNRPAFRRTFPELADALFASGDAPPCIVVWVDCWTSLGGSQFLDSPGTGRYHTYLCEEIVPWVDRHYRTLAAPEHRGIAGKSSGGYGGDGDADAAARPMGWDGDPRRGRLVRDVLPSRVPQVGTGAPRSLRGVV